MTEGSKTMECAAQCNMLKTSREDTTACNAFYFSGDSCVLLYVNMDSAEIAGEPRETVFIMKWKNSQKQTPQFFKDQSKKFNKYILKIATD